MSTSLPWETNTGTRTRSTRLVSELEKHNVPHESYIVGSEGHGMHYFRDRVEQYTKIEAFLAKYMAPDSPPVP